MADPTIRFRVLGAFEVLRDGVELDVRGGGPRVLLARLLSGRNAPVTVDQLIEAVWPEDGDRPQEPVKALQVIVSRVRTAIGPDAIQTRDGAYLLRVAEGACDADRFAALARSGRQALEARDAGRAAALLQEGLSLWHGEALSEYSYRDWAQAEIAHLEELRLAAEETYAQAELARGRHTDLVPRLEQLAVAHETREPTHALLMLALYRCGRHKEALDAFTRLRKALVEEGLEPGPESRRLQRQIYDHDPALHLSPATKPIAARPEGPAPLPDRLRFAARGPLVGRAAEVERIAVLARELGGRRHVVALAGDAGVGKTRLLAAAAQQLHEAGWPVLHGRAYEDSAIPYQPFVDALRHHLAYRPRLDLASDASLAPAAGPLAELLPEIEPLIPTQRPAAWVDPDAGLHVAFATVLSRVAAAERLVLVLDDLQWADRPTLRLVRDLVGRPGTAAVLVLAAYRSDEWTAKLGVLDDLIDDGRMTRLALGGLTPAQAAELAAELELPVSTSAARAVWAATDGNPFLLEHLLPEVTGVEDEQVAEALAAMAVPQPIRSVLMRRLRALPAEVAETLATAAVLGTEFHLGTLEAIGPANASVPDAVERALDARLLKPGAGPNGLAFAHDVLRQTLAESLPAFRTGRLHLAAARSLEQSGADPADFIHHYEAAAEIGGAAKAAEHGLVLGAGSPPPVNTPRRRGDSRRSCGPWTRWRRRRRWLSAAAPCSAVPERSSGWTSRPDGTRIAARRMSPRRAAKPPLLGLAAVGFASWTQYGAVDLEAISILQAALAALPREDSGVRAQVLCLLAVRLDATVEQEQREKLWREARAMAKKVGAEEAIALVLRFAPYVLWRPERLDERRSAAEEAIGRVWTGGLADAGVWGHVNAFVERVEAADLPGADTRACGRTQLAEDGGHAWFDWHLPMLQSSRLLLAGDVKGARDLAETSRTVRETQEPGEREAYAAQLAALARFGGAEREAAVVELEKQVERFPRRVVWRTLLADLALACGRRTPHAAPSRPCSRTRWRYPATSTGSPSSH